MQDLRHSLRPETREGGAHDLRVERRVARRRGLTQLLRGAGLDQPSRVGPLVHWCGCLTCGLLSEVPQRRWQRSEAFAPLAEPDPVGPSPRDLEERLVMFGSRDARAT